MAIALDTATNSGVKTTSTSYNWSHTCTGSNLVLVVGVSIRPAGCSVSGITYNAVALTKIRGDSNGNRINELWYLLNPATGAHSIAVTLTGSSPTGSDAHAVSLSGVKQTTPDANTGTNAASGTNNSVSITTIANNCWVVAQLNNGLDSGTFTIQNSGTQDSKVNNTGNHTGLQGHWGPKTPAGAITVGWTTPDNNWAISAASFAPAIAGSPPNWPIQTGGHFFGPRFS